MPRLLKTETDQRLTVSQRALTAAFGMLAIPKPVAYELVGTDSAIGIGLSGIAADSRRAWKGTENGSAYRPG